MHKYFKKLVSLVLKHIYHCLKKKQFVAFFNPNGITFHSNNLDFVITIVFRMSSLTILICQNPNYGSNVENQDDKFEVV
jgi:hypothetical protein